MIRRVYAIAASVVADALRRKVVYVVLLFGAVMAAAIPMLPSYGVGVVQGVYREVALSLTYIAGMAVVLALSANRIPGEVEHRTIYNVLSRSVRRWEYVLGTWLGIVATIGGVLAAFGVVVFAFGLFVYHVPMWQLWQGIVAVWLEASVIAAFCMAISAVSGPVVVATAALAFLFIAHVRSGILSSRSVRLEALSVARYLQHHQPGLPRFRRGGYVHACHAARIHRMGRRFAGCWLSPVRAEGSVAP